MLKIAVGNVHLDLGAGRRGVDMGPSAIHLAGLKKGVEDLGHRVVENFAVGVPSQEMADPGDPHARFLTEIAGYAFSTASSSFSPYTHGWPMRNAISRARSSLIRTMPKPTMI